MRIGPHPDLPKGRLLCVQNSFESNIREASNFLRAELQSWTNRSRGKYLYKYICLAQMDVTLTFLYTFSSFVCAAPVAWSPTDRPRNFVIEWWNTVAEWWERSPAANLPQVRFRPGSICVKFNCDILYTSQLAYLRQTEKIESWPVALHAMEQSLPFASTPMANDQIAGQSP